MRFRKYKRTGRQCQNPLRNLCPANIPLRRKILFQHLILKLKIQFIRAIHQCSIG